MALERNPENPGVYNPDYFANLTDQTYKQTTLVILHRVNNWTAFVIGLTSVSLVLYCVWRKTPPDFRPYSRMLCFCAFIDGSSIIIDLLCQTQLKITNSILFFSMMGPASWLSYRHQCWIMGVQEMVPIFGISMIPVQYFYRYYTISRKRPPTVLQTFGLFAFAFLLTAISGVWISVTYLRIYDVNQVVDYSSYWYTESKIPQLFVLQLTDRFFVLMSFYITILNTGSYVLIVFFARRTYRLTIGQTMSTRTKVQARQLERILLVQSVFPLMSAFIPSLLMVISLVFNLDIGLLGEIIAAVLAWFPVLNSLSNFGITPYREFVFQLVGRIFGCSSRFETSTPISEVATTRGNPALSPIIKL